MTKKIKAWFIVVLLLGIIVLAVWYSQETEYHEGVLYDVSTYAFDPQTIIASLERKDENVFTSMLSEPEEGWPLLEAPSHPSWHQDDYLKIADRLHQFVWNESLEDWSLSRMYFRVFQCQNPSGVIDYASLSFYQRKGGLYLVHGINIDPLRGIASVGTDHFKYSGLWKDIDLNSVTIGTADLVWQLAESKGGQEARLAVNKECHIGIYFAPYVLEHSFITHPFNQHDWGWKIYYEDNSSSYIFEMTIDPFTGGYTILNPKK
jgi:hypothetical protein